jgi:hypothetical protein
MGAPGRIFTRGQLLDAAFDGAGGALTLPAAPPA